MYYKCIRSLNTFFPYYGTKNRIEKIVFWLQTKSKGLMETSLLEFCYQDIWSSQYWQVERIPAHNKVKPASSRIGAAALGKKVEDKIYADDIHARVENIKTVSWSDLLFSATSELKT